MMRLGKGRVFWKGFVLRNGAKRTRRRRLLVERIHPRPAPPPCADGGACCRRGGWRIGHADEWVFGLPEHTQPPCIEGARASGAWRGGQERVAV